MTKTPYPYQKFDPSGGSVSAAPSPDPSEDEVEAVARAICALEHDPDGPTSDIYIPDDPDAIYVWAGFRPHARAAIAAMRPKQHHAIGKWLSAALEDPSTCEEMKADIRDWFAAGEPSPVRPTLSEEDRARVEELLRDALDYTGQRYAPIDTEACNEYARLCDAAHDKITEALSLIDKLTEAG